MNSSKTTDVLIVGAGPVGLTLAVALLSRGREVTIVDKLKGNRQGSLTREIVLGNPTRSRMYG